MMQLRFAVFLQKHWLVLLPKIFATLLNCAASEFVNARRLFGMGAVKTTEKLTLSSIWKYGMIKVNMTVWALTKNILKF